MSGLSLSRIGRCHCYLRLKLMCHVIVTIAEKKQDGNAFMMVITASLENIFKVPLKFMMILDCESVLGYGKLHTSLSVSLIQTECIQVIFCMNQNQYILTLHMNCWLISLHLESYDIPESYCKCNFQSTFVHPPTSVTVVT